MTTHNKTISVKRVAACAVILLVLPAADWPPPKTVSHVSHTAVGFLATDIVLNKAEKSWMSCLAPGATIGTVWEFGVNKNANALDFALFMFGGGIRCLMPDEEPRLTITPVLDTVGEPAEGVFLNLTIARW